MIQIHNKAKRNSNIEFLRIIAMLMIVFSHYVSHGSLYQSTEISLFNKIVIDAMFLGNLGVAIFVIITGYFMSTSKFNINRIVNLWLQTLFYSVVLFVAFCLVDRNNFSVGATIKSFLPVITSSYWFVTAYIILCFFMPFLNKLFSVITRKQFLLLVIALIVIWFVLPTVAQLDFSRYAGRVTQFISFYCIGGYLRYYPDNVMKSKKISALVLALTAIAMLSSVVVFDYLSTKNELFVGKSEYFYATFSVVQLFLGIAMFSLAVNMKPKYSSFINTIGGCTFGVYLIHDNRLVRSFLWDNIFNNSHLAYSGSMIMHMVASVFIVFAVCTSIEMFRKYVIEKYIFSKPYSFVYKLVKKIVCLINEKALNV